MAEAFFTGLQFGAGMAGLIISVGFALGLIFGIGALGRHFVNKLGG